MKNKTSITYKRGVHYSFNATGKHIIESILRSMTHEAMISKYDWEYVRHYEHNSQEVEVYYQKQDLKTRLIKMSKSESRETLKKCVALCMSSMESGALSCQDAKDIACDALIKRTQLNKEKLAEFKERYL